MGTTKIKAVKVLHEPKITRVRLARSERYNAIDIVMLQSIAEALSEAAGDVLVLEGEGAMFSVGPDIAELASLDGDSAREYSQLAHRVLNAIENWPGVTIANMTGYCLGSGLELALGCDVLVGSPDLRVGLPGLAWAIIPCMGGLRRLSYRVTTNTCSELFLNGDVLTASSAHAIGLLDRVVADSVEFDLLCREMTEFSPQAINAIRTIRLDGQGPIDVAGEAKLFAQAFANGECQKRLKQLLAS
jgi:enoyl-CoA hydratase